MSGRIVVLGMHRSGTSCVGELLAAMGAYFGPTSMGTSGTVENPHGPFERRDLRRLCHFILKQARADWWATSRFSPDRLPADSGARIADMLAPMLADLNAHEPWFIKEPRLCILLPMLRAQLGPVVAVCVWRDPLEVAQSLQTRDAMPLEFGIALWERYVRASFGAGVPRVIVSYNRLVADPEGTTRTLLDDLTALGVGGLRMPGPAQLARVIDPGTSPQRTTRRRGEHVDAIATPLAGSPASGRSQRRRAGGAIVTRPAGAAWPLREGAPAADESGRLSIAGRSARQPRAARDADARCSEVCSVESRAMDRVVPARQARPAACASTWMPRPLPSAADLTRSGIGRNTGTWPEADPLMHFVRYGASEGRDPSPSHPTSRNLRAALEQAAAR